MAVKKIAIWWLVSTLILMRMISGQNCGLSYSIYGYELRGHTISESVTWSLGECVMKCEDDINCLSLIFRRKERVCMLKNRNRYTNRMDFGMSDSSLVYMDKTSFRTCAEIKQNYPSSPSGYYMLSLTQDRTVYCDMERFGGGWALVVSINASENFHLQRAEHNCLNGRLCVPHANGTLSARKLSDQDIHVLAATEGTFRLDVDLSYTVFYQIPSGQDKFNSRCNGKNCPRIITSDCYPYHWKSNCKGTDVGYQIGNCKHVFDNRDNSECDISWQANGYNDERRALYGSTCKNGDMGLNRYQQGMLWVR